MAQKVVTVTSGQNIYDIVLQLYGDVSKVYEFIQLNIDKIPNIVFQDLTGLSVVYEEQSNYVANFYKTNKITISTRDNSQDSSFRITEEDDFRILENLDNRIIQ